MVSITSIQASNGRASSVLPSGLVAVFVGATRGIGETSMKQFAKHTRNPKIYFVGRGQADADRVIGECKALNAEGSYEFIKADTSLLKNVDEVCREIKRKVKVVNLLFMTTGTLRPNIKTDEGLHFAVALACYARTRFVVNLLPELQRATTLRRVVSVFVGTKEGVLDMDNLPGWNKALMASRGHAGSLVTMSLEALAKRAPDVSFVHNFPGTVKTDIAKDTTGLMMSTFKAVLWAIGPLVYMPNQECGERQLFFATSARFPARKGEGVVAGVPLDGGVEVAKGSDGVVGSGVYSIDQEGESAGPAVVEVLTKARKEGSVEKVWEHIEGEFKRVTGVGAI